MKALSSLDSPSNVNVENLLYQYDFNTPTFFNYCTKCCNESLADTPGQHMQMEIIISWEDRIIGLPTRTSLRWMKRDESIQIQLKSFLKEKKLYLQQRINLRRAELHDYKLAEEKDRMLINLPVQQFGLFIRIFMENGILQKENVGKIFSYYARHFRTPNTPFISAESLQKKSTDVEFSTAVKMSNADLFLKVEARLGLMSIPILFPLYSLTHLPFIFILI